MKKKFFVILLTLLIGTVFLLSSCDKSFDTYIKLDYMSKITGLQEAYVITHINAIDKQGESVKISKRDFDDFDEKIRDSAEFFGMDKVYNANNEKILYEGNKCYILTNGNSYFALGKNNDGYYTLTELNAILYYHDTLGDRIVYKSFAMVPYLNGYTYNAISGQPDDILLMVPYEWNYIKLFYSRLEYAHIDDEQRKITINAYAGETDSDYNDMNQNDVDEVYFYYVTQNNSNYIQIPVENFQTFSNDID